MVAASRRVMDGCEDQPGAIQISTPRGGQKRDAGQLNENAADFTECLGAQSFDAPAAKSRIHGATLPWSADNGHRGGR